MSLRKDVFGDYKVNAVEMVEDPDDGIQTPHEIQQR